jgi:hypothetical protein
MRPNLSFENLAAVLAALGTSAIVACGGGTPQPVQANEVTPATTTPAGNASCSAKGCGASPATAAAGATTPTTVPAATTPTTPAADAASGTTPTATATPVATAATTATAAVKKQPPKGSTANAPKKKPAAGEASCGAGTCASDPKQKAL